MKTLVIIGAGFSGAITAIQFLKHSPPGVRVVLINRSGAMARGLAYGTNSAQHLLNVPAGNMTALVDEPESFLSFCQGRLPDVLASSFVPRKLYGDYLASMLDAAERKCVDVSLTRLSTEVHSLRPNGNGAVVELANGEVLNADQVVLAFGHFAPIDPPGVTPAILAGRYQQDPWDANQVLPETNRPLLLLGSGLTALDVALGSNQTNHGPIHMLSRRGLLPLAHRPHRGGAVSVAGFSDRLLDVPPTVTNYLREIRQQIKASADDGVDWRDLLAALRSATPALWMRLPENERRRFLRHLQPYWDVHRHRVAPETYERLQQALASGRIKPIAGRIRTMELCAEGLRVSIQRRGGQSVEQIDVAQVINCTGPNSNLHRVNDRLIVQLRDEGFVQPDPHGLGLCVDGRLAVKSAEGIASSWLSYVGPMLKADFWEATAVPELRQSAKFLACRLAEDFRLQSIAG
jgi:uncharacterized NAD(P)/FAD-binding protein YdhS